MPFINLNDLETEEPRPGLNVRFVHSDTMTLVFGNNKVGYVFPAEQHHNDQIMIVMSGEMELTVGNETKILKAGEVAVIPPNVPHSGRVIKDAYVIEAFYPRSRRADRAKKQA